VHGQVKIWPTHLRAERRADRSWTCPHKFPGEFCDHSPFGQMISKVIEVNLGIVEKKTIVRVGLFIFKGKSTFGDIKLPGAQGGVWAIIDLLCRLNGFPYHLFFLY